MNLVARRAGDVASGKQTRVSSEPIYGPTVVLHHSWSPDSRYLAYTRNTSTYFNRVFLYSVSEDRSYPVTDGLSDATSPVFDASGKYRGAYQFDYRTWQSVGGWGDPAAASKLEQDYRAALLYARRGPQPWPVCGYR